MATRCNEYMLRHVSKIWADGLFTIGMLVAMLKDSGACRESVASAEDEA